MRASDRILTLLLLGSASCFDSGSKHDTEPPIDGLVTPLTGGNPSGEDDDPTVVLDAHGTIHVVWFSDRDGTKDLYYVRSTSIDVDGATIHWTDPLQLTDLDATQYPPPTRGDNYPWLWIDADDMLNVTWHRWNLANECHVMFLRFDGSAAGLALASEVPVTVGANFDRYPSLVRRAADDLRIYFCSTTRGTPGENEVFVARSIDDGAHWPTIDPVPGLNATGAQSAFAHVVPLAGGEFIATFARWAGGATGDALDPTTDIFYAESSDGEAWTVEGVTHDVPDTLVDFSPALFFDHDGAASIAWATNALGDPAGDLVRVSVAERALYPASAHVVAPALGLPDHSPRIVALTAGGRRVFVSVWVRIADGVHNQVVYRLSSAL